MKRLLVLTATLALGACATGKVQFRELPPETPRADNAAAIKKLEAAQKAAAQAATESKENENLYKAPPIAPSDAPPLATYDPWERLNRFTYRFNTRFDENIFLPVANAYGHLPSPVRGGVHNFFSNLSEVDSMLNFALQGRLGYGVRSLTRFAINSTVGIGGLFDVAAKIHLESAPTGFGTTLAKWGMHPGPYLVIPLLGPSTLRDGVGLLGDYGSSYAINVGGLYQGNGTYYLGAVNAIDQRANIGFRYYSTGSPFEYETIRFLYVRKRLIEDEGLHQDDAQQERKRGEPAGQ